MVELLYAVNPGLVLHGPFLPIGTVVRIPIPPPAEAVKSVTPVRLWG